MTPRLILIGADKGGVGKTFLARALVDYYGARATPARIFDTEPAPGVLARFFPAGTIADIGSTRGQMDVFDNVGQAAVTLVDMRAGVLSRVLATMRDAGLLKDADAGVLKLTVLHVIDSNMASIAAIEPIAAALAGGGKQLLVKNHASDGGFFDWTGADLEIPHLDAHAREDVDKKALAFAAYANDASGGHSRLLRGLVAHWLESVWREFDRAGLAQS